MRRLLLPIVLTSLFAIPALAQDADNPLGERVGTYFGSGEGGELTVTLKHLEKDAYAVSIETVVPMENNFPGCGGGINGEALLTETGGNFFVENEDYVPGSDNQLLNERYCEIKLVFDDDGFLNIEEQSGCLAYHGASCEFTGQLVNEAAAG